MKIMLSYTVLKIVKLQKAHTVNQLLIQMTPVG